MLVKPNHYFDNCLKNRHWYYRFMLLWAVAFFFGCGVKTNTKSDQDKLQSINSFFLIESKCNINRIEKSPIFLEIQQFYNKAIYGRVKIVGNWLAVPRYHFMHPLIVNEEILKDKLDKLELDYIKGEIKLNDLLEMMEMANRFEGQKCNFKELIDKNATDLTSYLKFTHRCARNFQSECNEDLLKQILNETDERDVISLCESSKRIYQCKREYDFSKRGKSIDKMASFYLKQVEKDKFQSLFLLRDNHASFQCEKSAGKISLTLRVFNEGFDDDTFNEIVNNIAKVWTKNNLVIKTEIALSGMDYDLKITAIQHQISHVKNNDLSTMYLDKDLERANLVNVAAHEFGHNLGFPDCYIEYFDTTKNALIYYELSPESRNIMCSLKAGFQVEDQYIDQIIQKACKFQSI